MISVVHAQEQDSSEWLFVYYMPYDNDLSEQAPAILEQLETAKKYENVTVVVQLDLADSSGMQRIVIAGDTIYRDTLASESITGRKELRDFLKWTAKRFHSEHTALFFLDHGGRQDEIGQDRYPDSTFLKTTDMRKAIRAFNRKTGHSTDLIYLQVCSKASLETLYEFHDIADYTLASQLLLGAPNYYYEETFKSLQSTPTTDGGTLARFIVQAEDTSMYQSLTCVNNAGFPAVREAFVDYVDVIDERDDFGFTFSPRYVHYANDLYWDFGVFLSVINGTDSLEIAQRIKLENLVASELVEFVRYAPGADRTFTGLSIATLSRKRLKDFGYMRFYRDFRISSLPLY